MTNKDYKELFNPYYDSFIKDLFGILEIPSVLKKYDEKNLEEPFGSDIKKALTYMLDLAKKDGFKTVNVDNYAGFVEYGSGDKLLLILCHLDVVPATGEWENPPFKPIIKDDKIIARGSSDDKGPLLSSYYALKMLKDEGYDPKMRIRLFFGCDEESGSRCLKRYIEKYGECDYGFSPDASFPCIFAEKGISSEKMSGVIDDPRIISFNSGTVSNIVPDYAEAKLSIDLKQEFNKFLTESNLKGGIKEDNIYYLYGKSAHGSTPYCGINAATTLIEFLSHHISNNFIDLVGNYMHEDFVGEKEGIAYKDDEMGRVSINPAVFKLEDSKFEIISNIRYPKGFMFENEMKKYQDFLLGFGVKLEVLHNSIFHYVPLKSHLITSLLKAYRKHTGDMSEPISIGGGTYARDFKNAVAFGAAFKDEEECAHMPNEYMSINSLIKATYIYKDAIKNICD